MYKVLIVDDEPRQLRAMVNIIQKMKPKYEVHSAQNGQQALEVINNMPIDILLTDIRMPMMDGLQLIDEVCKQGHQMKTIILSGYREFEYAQKSIGLGVFDYLLKPIKKQELEGILDKVEKSMQQVLEQNTQKEHMKEQLKNTLPIYFERQVNKWIRKEINEADLKKIESIFPFKGIGIVIVTSISQYTAFVETHTAEEVQEMLQHVKFSIKDFLNPLGHSISAVLESREGYIATILNSQKDFNIIEKDNLELIDRFVKRIYQEFSLYISVGISNKYDNIFEDVSKGFEEAMTAVEYKFYRGIPSIIHFSAVHTCFSKKIIDLYELESGLSNAIRDLDKNMVLKILNEWIKKTIAQEDADPVKVKDNVTYMMLGQAKILKNIILDKEYEEFMTYSDRLITRSEDYRELRHNIYQVLSDIIDILNGRSKDNNHIIIEKCKKYIEDHYSEDISLTDIAQKYHFNPSYFSNIFKKLTGIGFAEYVAKIRLERAKYLLKYTDAKISEISIESGFKNDTYFITLFKREFGVSPYKYRQFNKEEKQNSNV
jgi:two-component system response regulator YesN